jgi:hypothetical protein
VIRAPRNDPAGIRQGNYRIVYPFIIKIRTLVLVQDLGFAIVFE